MAKKIKITMLGTSQTGKTCYMLAMYSVMSFGVNGFTLSATDPDDHLDLTEEWENIVYSEGKDRWPPPTKQEQDKTYSFNFNYALTTRLMEFDWFDYRGQALRERAKKGAEDVKKLRKRIKDSSCLFLCIPGNLLAEGDLSIDLMTTVSTMNNLIQQTRDSEEKVPIVILITKYDLCQHRPKQKIVDDIRSKLLNILFLEGQGWPVMICPVTLGLELAENIDCGLIAPTGVHLPLIFAIQSDYVRTLAEIRVEEKAAQSKLEDRRQMLREINSRGWFTKVIDRIRKTDKTEEVINDLKYDEEELENIEKQRGEIQKKLNLLNEELNNKDQEDQVYIYFDGERVKEYD